MEGMPTAVNHPSKTTNADWVDIEVPDRPPRDYDTIGKWQVFVPRATVDAVWAKVAELVLKGDLGPRAKVSTAKDSPINPGDPKNHVIVVYAADWRDVADVRRILRTLRQSGIAEGWLHFKRDRETLSGKYLVRGDRGVSVWNARPGSDEISTKWLTGKRVIVTDENVAEVVAGIERLEAEQPCGCGD
jgi:hypothetical protein